MHTRKSIVLKVLLVVFVCTALSSYLLLLTSAKYLSSSSSEDKLTIETSLEDLKKGAFVNNVITVYSNSTETDIPPNNKLYFVFLNTNSGGATVNVTARFIDYTPVVGDKWKVRNYDTDASNPGVSAEYTTAEGIAGEVKDHLEWELYKPSSTPRLIELSFEFTSSAPNTVVKIEFTLS